jgi:hypothetical protein
MGLRSFLQRHWEGVTMVVEERTSDQASQEASAATAPAPQAPAPHGAQAAGAAGSSGGTRPVSCVPLEFITQTLLPSLLSDVHLRQLGGSGATASSHLLVGGGPQVDVQVRWVGRTSTSVFSSALPVMQVCLTPAAHVHAPWVTWHLLKVLMPSWSAQHSQTHQRPLP